MKYTLLCFYLLVFHCSEAQELKFCEKQKVKSALRKMVKDDQRYRVLIVNKPKLNQDSLWSLQRKLDDRNKNKLVDLIRNYGYPSIHRIGNEKSVIVLLHLTYENDFMDLLHILERELDKGNLRPWEYAVWYDRCQVNMHRDNAFGVYGQVEFCAEELARVNLNRRSIGLEALNASKTCE